MKFDGKRYTLDSGIPVYSGQHSGQLSFDEDGDIYVGYDSQLYLSEVWRFPNEAEKLEIAEFMIRRWTEFRDSLQVGASHE